MLTAWLATLTALALLAGGCGSGASAPVAGSSDEEPATGVTADATPHAHGGTVTRDREQDPSARAQGPTERSLARLRALDEKGGGHAHAHNGGPQIRAAAHRPEPVNPQRLVIPAIAVDTDVIELGLDRDGAMEVPTDFAQAGWFKHGPMPGRVGPAVIAGHVDSRSGPAVFYRLRELEPGDRIEVHGDQGRVVFEVRSLEQHAKDEFPTERVYGGTPGPELRLITCGGVFDRDERSYRDNVIVYATRVDE
jgi:hypothetical protein